MKAASMALLLSLAPLLLNACDGGGVSYTVDSAPDQAAVADTASKDCLPRDASPDTPPQLDVGQDLPGDMEPLPDLVSDLPPPDVPPTPCAVDADCDDGDKCTMDRCVDGSCANHLLPPGFCCAGDGDCDDGVACTVDQCLAGACWNLPEDSTCCTNAADCEDFDDCTADLCVGSSCAHVFASDGAACKCEDFLDCDDGLPCTDQSCVEGACIYQASPAAAGCCAEAGDCDDGDPATEDVCVQLTCGNAPLGLCLVDEHCDDGDPCTEDACTAGLCASTLQEGCCHVDAQCTDGLTMTQDSCVGGDCVHGLPDAGGPCAVPADCPAAPSCLATACIQAQCSYGFEAGPGCCLDAGDCDDGDACTADSCGADLLCQHSSVEGLVPQIVWDFGDPALPGFAITGGAGPGGGGASVTKFVTPPRALYFGDPAAGNFATGGAVSGEARSPQVQLPASGPITLQGATFIDVEPLFSRDLVWIAVEVSGDDVEVWNKEAVGGTTAQAWLPLEADLSAFAGEAVRLVFGFDSVDEVENQGEGVYFDDVSLSWTCGE